MTVFGTNEPREVSLRAVVEYVVGMGGLAFTLTTLWLSMRAVMGIGGFCATGGPYVPAVECPDAVVALTPLSIFGLFIFGGLAAWGGASLGGPWLGLIALGWPALFLSLGWNFLDFGLHPPGGDGEIVWSWLFCAAIFGLMGGVPLIVGLRGAQLASTGHRAYAGGRVLIGPRGGLAALNQLRQALDAGPSGAREASSAPPAEPDAAPPAEPGPDVAERLERLARLHDAGDLTDAEFQAARRATIDGAGR
jgi:Short C-terminal domain